MMKKTIPVIIILSVCAFLLCGCGEKKVVTNNKKSKSEVRKEAGDGASGGRTETSKGKTRKIIKKKDAVYRCDFKADRKAYKGRPDKVVGDRYYATQINDWYKNFKDYEGKTVEIESYYIGEFKPFDFIGRYGPSCPYCKGGYVCFEILYDKPLKYRNAKDWIRVIGILRVGELLKKGVFYYIGVLKLEKMKKKGKDTVSD